MGLVALVRPTPSHRTDLKSVALRSRTLKANMKHHLSIPLLALVLTHSIYLFIYLSIYLSDYLSIYLPIYVCMYVSIDRSIHLYT